MTGQKPHTRGRCWPYDATQRVLSSWGRAPSLPLASLPGHAGAGPSPTDVGDSAIGCCLLCTADTERWRGGRGASPRSSHAWLRRGPTHVGGRSGLGGCEAAPLLAVPGAAGEGPRLWGPARGMPDADQERRSPAAERARGVRSSSPLGCARSSGQGSRSCGDRPAACLMRIRLSGSKGAAILRRSGARGVRSSFPPGCARAAGKDAEC